MLVITSEANSLPRIDMLVLESIIRSCEKLYEQIVERLNIQSLNFGDVHGESAGVDNVKSREFFRYCQETHTVLNRLFGGEKVKCEQKRIPG